MTNRKYVKSGIWYTVGNLLIKGISFLTLPIFTRLLSTSDFGKFNIFVSYENILNVIIGLGVAGTIKTAYFDFEDRFEKYISSIMTMIACSAVIVAVIINIVISLVGFKGNSIWSVGTSNFLVCCSLATALYNIISMKYVIQVQYKKNLLISFLYTALSIITSIVLCYTIYNEERYMGRIVGNGLPLILISFSISIFSILKQRSLYQRQYWCYSLRMGIPLIFHSLSLVVMQQADKIMIDGYCGSELTGIYSLACNISLILTIVQSSVDNSWSPWFYSNLKEKNYDELKKHNANVVLLFAYLTMGFCLVSPELIRITSTEEYAGAIYALIPLNLSVYASFMYMFAVNKEYYFKKTKIIAAGTIVTTIVDIVLNAILIPRFGFISAAYTTLISKVILFIIHWVASNRIDKNIVVSPKLLIVSYVMVSIVCYIAILCAEFFIVRYFLCIFMTGIGIIYLKKNGLLEKLIRRNRHE